MYFIHLPAAFPPPCPTTALHEKTIKSLKEFLRKSYPKSTFFFKSAEKSYKYHFKWVPGGSWGRLLILLGAAFGSLQRPKAPKTKRKTKLTWRTLAPGSKLGLKILTFLEKAVPDMKKWVPRQALEKRSCLEGVKTLKVRTLIQLSAVFQVPGPSKSSKNVVLSFKIDGTTVSQKNAGLSEITRKVSLKGAQGSQKEPQIEEKMDQDCTEDLKK